MVFDFDPSQKKALDTAEGLGYGYQEKVVEVLMEGKAIKVYIYVADDKYIDDSLPVYTWYKDFVMMGAEEHGLPGHCIAAAAAKDAIKDPDTKRDNLERSKILTG